MAPEPRLPIANEDGDAADPDVEADAAPAGRASTAGHPPPPVTRAPATPARRATSAFVEGRKVQATTQIDDVIRIKANEHPNFILTFDPERWGYVPSLDRILPDFGKIRLVPGVGRVDSKNNPAAALVDAGKCGRTVIYDKQIPGGYLREYDMIGGIGFLPRWERVKVSGRSAKIEVDWPEFIRCIEAMIEDGVITPISDMAIAIIRESATVMINLSEPRKGQPRIDAEIAMYEKQIAACDRLLAG